MNTVIGYHGCHREVTVAAMMDTINSKRMSMNDGGSE
jgi:hypothetical protein